MACIRLTPMIGQPRNERLESLRGCHMIHERGVVKSFEAGKMGRALEDAVKELALADRLAAMDGKLRFVLEIEL